MDTTDIDTIAAFSTPPGESGLAVLRISGPEAAAVCDRCFVPNGSRFPQPSAMTGYTMAPGRWLAIDDVVLACFRAPHSFTGEDVYEVSCHGGHAVREAILDSVFKAGARPAEAGEFSRRAFINGKMDLSEAEAVMDLISADAARQAELAYRQLKGGVSRAVRTHVDRLYRALARLEMYMDWEEEEERPEDRVILREELVDAADALRRLAGTFTSGRVIREGLSVVIAGRPNVGKSSLLNALAGRDRAIVSDIPGTTRDTVEIDVTVGGYLVHLTDTAGLAIDTDDPIEQAGVRRARQALEDADLVMWVLSPPLPPHEARADEAATIDRLRADGRPLLLMLGKDDLRPTLAADEDPAIYAEARFPDVPSMPWSERHPEDVVRVREMLVHFIEHGQLEETEAVPIADAASHAILAHARHKHAVDRAEARVEQTIRALDDGLSFDLVAITLKEALTELSAITGDDVSETLIETIFSRFCIGK
ncbi:MAG: tRNA uridine-5-carboxymethylaminomethyl(34) synthesis GTPase MnmE [Saccharofermentanales bacterium]|jgi:tRNA modification GTPase